LVKGVHVRGDDAQDIVFTPGDGRALDDLRPLGHGRFKDVQILTRGQAELDDGIDFKVQTQQVGIQKRDTLAYQAAILQSLDPAPARRGGKPDAISDLCNRQPCILLKDVEDASVNRIQFVSQMRFSKRGFDAIKYPYRGYCKGIFRKARTRALCYASNLKETRS